MAKNHKRIMIFGVFDRLHPGHLAFIEQAAEQGDEVVAVVARDSAVVALKKHHPEQNEEVRRKTVENLPHITKAVLGDEGQGMYDVIIQHSPDVICLGYDQDELEKSLQERMSTGTLAEIPVFRLQPHEPERWHTSLLAAQA